MILIFLVLRGKPLPTRGAIVQNTLGAAPRPRNLLLPSIAGVVVALGFLIFTEGSVRGAVIVTFTVAIIALSQVVVTGFAGQISLAQLTLAGVAAFMMSRLTTDWGGVPFPIAPVLAAVAATVVGVVVGLPALRIRGSAGRGRHTQSRGVPGGVLVPQQRVQRRNRRGGCRQGSVAVRPGSRHRFREHLPNIAFGVLCLIVLTLVGLGVARLRTSRLGASMLAVRANERSAAAAGVNVSRTKLVAFAIGAFIAGIGGSLMAYQQTVVVPESYAAIAGIGMFALVYLAGVTCVSGGVLAGIMGGAGGILFVLLDRAVNLGTYYHVITGILLVITIIANPPEGIISEVHKATNWLRTRAFGRKDTVAELELAISPGTDSPTIEAPPRAPRRGDPVVEGDRRPLRRRGRRRQRVVRRPRRRDHRPHRTQRSRQDHPHRRHQRIRGLDRQCEPGGPQPRRAAPPSSAAATGWVARSRASNCTTTSRSVRMWPSAPPPPGTARTRRRWGGGRVGPALRVVAPRPGGRSAGEGTLAGTAAACLGCSRTCRASAGGPPRRTGRRTRQHRELVARAPAPSDPRCGGDRRDDRPRHGTGSRRL